MASNGNADLAFVNGAVYTVDATRRRASAIAVTNSIGRLATAAGPLLAGIIATQWFGGSLALAIASVSGLVVLAIIGLVMLPETHGSMALADDQLVTTDESLATADVPLRRRAG